MSRGARYRAVRLLPLAAVVAACGDAGSALDPVSVARVAGEGASNPTVALSRDGGDALVAWVATVDGRSDVYLSRAAPGEAFAAPVRVNDVPGDAAPHAQAPARVASGPRGEVYVAWQNSTRVEGRRFPASDLRFARSPDGGRSFEPAVHVNDDAGGPPASHTFHDMAVAPDGTIYVSWIDGRSRADSAHGTHHGGGEGGPEIRVARSTDGGRSPAPITGRASTWP